MKQTFNLVHPLARKRAMAAVADAPEGFCVTVAEPTRSLEQNSLLWPLLDALSKQINWHGQRLSSEEWKDVLSASLKRQRVVPGIDGGFVVLGQRTSQMGKREFSELLELVYAFGAQQGVDFEPATA
jgi:hypothetical protein